MIIAYKAFNKYLSCQGFQFEVGKEYSIEKGVLGMCYNGFHCCEDMLNCLEYYESDSRFCEVEIGEESMAENGKTVTSAIRILRELGKKEIDERLTGVQFTNEGKRWYKSGKLHRDGDLPAIEWATGYKVWYKNGKRHRDGDLSAIEDDDGNKEWYKNGELHRDGDLPAREWANGDKYWYKNGNLHRDGDLPAVEYADGTKAWYKNDELHRDGDLPAVEWADGSRYKNMKNGEHLPHPE